MSLLLERAHEHAQIILQLPTTSYNSLHPTTSYTCLFELVKYNAFYSDFTTKKYYYYIDSLKTMIHPSYTQC